jgi:hypothetical protein
MNRFTAIVWDGITDDENLRRVAISKGVAR